MARINVIMAGWLNFWICSLLVIINTRVHGDTEVPLTVLESAIPKGAVCLDGSAPAYSYVEGFGNGSDSWIVFLQGGGWCNGLSNCYERSNTFRGSSDLMDSQATFYSLMDSNCAFNPHFCNWHKVYIYYCDGSSFMSDIMDSKATLSFRGANIFNVMIEEMLAKGMRNATQAILSGSSAGGLATMLHCDKFRELFPSDSRVKCISDSGFFIHGKGLYGEETRENYFANVIKTHAQPKVLNKYDTVIENLTQFLPSTCTSKRNPSLCLFAEYFAGDIRTPLFIIESAFDQKQLTYNVLGQSSTSCLNSLMSCNSTELGIMRDFRTTLIKTLLGMKKSSSRGMFVHSCYLHCALPFSSETWLSITLANKTIEQAVADWYFDRSSFQEIDTKHFLPGNCTNIVNEKKSLSPAALNGLMSSIFSSFPFLFSFRF